jgi:hypothetical protein
MQPQPIVHHRLIGAYRLSEMRLFAASHARNICRCVGWHPVSRRRKLAGKDYLNDRIFLFFYKLTAVH